LIKNTKRKVIKILTQEKYLSWDFNMDQKYSISVILPAYNEEGNIKEVIEEMNEFLLKQDKFNNYEIIVVEDGSRDNTTKILRGLASRIPYLKLITHCKNLGYGKALLSGVKISQHPLVFFMDADRQFNIKEIAKMYSFIKDFDIIAGYRYKRKDSVYRIVLGKIYTWLVSLLFGLKIKDLNCGFKLVKKKILDVEYIYSNAGVFYTEIFLKAKNKGYKIKQIPIEHFPRLRGRQSGASLKVIFNSIIDLIRLRYFLEDAK